MPLLNPYYSTAALLLHLNGADNSTVFSDSGPAALTMTRTGSTVIRTTQSVFGGASAFFDGASTLESPAALSSLAFGTGVFRFGLRARTSSLAGPRALWSIETASGTMRLVVNADGSLTLTPGLAGTSPATSAAGVFTVNTWHHIEVGRLTNGFIYVYVNGSLAMAATVGSVSFPAGKLILGRDTVGNVYHFGFLDEVFVFPGTTLQTSGVPADAWADRMPQISGTVRSAANAPAARVITAYQDGAAPGGNAKVGITTSDAITGDYTITVTTDQPCTVVAQPLAGEPRNALVLRNMQPV